MAKKPQKNDADWDEPQPQTTAPEVTPEKASAVAQTATTLGEALTLLKQAESLPKGPGKEEAIAAARKVAFTIQQGAQAPDIRADEMAAMNRACSAAIIAESLKIKASTDPDFAAVLDELTKLKKAASSA